MKTFFKNNSQEIFMPERLVFEGDAPKKSPEQVSNAPEIPQESKERPKTYESAREDTKAASDSGKVALHGEIWEKNYREKVAKIDEKFQERTKTIFKEADEKVEQITGKKKTTNVAPVAPPSPPTIAPEQKAAAEGLEEFKKTWLGSIVGLFGGEKAESDLKEAYAGKGFWGFIGTLLGMTALSKGIESLAGKNPKAKQYIDQGKGFFKGFLDKIGFGNWIATEISKDSFEKAVQNTVGEAAMDSNYKFSESATVPSGAELVLMKNDKKPMSITAADNMKVVVGGKEKDLKKGDSIASDKFDIKLPAGTEIPAGTQFAEGFKIVVAPAVASTAPKKDVAPENKPV